MTPAPSVWRKVKARAFPQGAITFHLSAWSRGELSETEAEAARALLEGGAFERLLVLHGNALRIGAETVVLVGPRGIGKSTLSRRLVRRGEAALIEDGLVLAGEAAGRWTLIETGTLEVLRRASRIGAETRRFLPRPASRKGAFRPSRRLLRVLERFSFAGSVLLSRGRGRSFTSRRLPIDRVVVAESLDDSLPSYETDGRTMRPVADLGARVPGGTAVRRLSLAGSPADVRRRLEESVRR